MIGWALGLVIVTNATVSTARTQDVVTAAEALCQVFRNTGMSPECKVDGWHSYVDAWLDTTSGEATKICAGMVELVPTWTDAFSHSPGWQLRIMSPYSGEHPLAACALH
jgi:hypothetical protein